MKKKLALGSLVVLALATSRSTAGQTTANLGVSAAIQNNCTISTTPLAFGDYDPIVTNATAVLNGSGTVVIACTKGATTTMGLGLGQNATGSTRRMTDGTNFLTYEAYQPPSTTPAAACAYTSPTIWGTGGANLFTPAAAPSKAARTYNVCGQMAAGQDQPAGSYADTVVASVNF